MSDDNLIQVPVLVTGFSPRADRSWKLVFETRELIGSEVALLADNYQGEGWLVFKPNADGVEASNIPTDDADAGVKSPAQRLRGVLYKFWKQNVDKGDFEAYWRAYCQKQIEQIGEKIDPKED